MSTKARKNIIIIILTTLILIIASGCGSGPADRIDPNAIAYIAENKPFDIGENYFNNVVSYEGYLHLIINEWLEDEMRVIDKMVKVSLSDGSAEETELFNLPENFYINSFTINENGNYLLLANGWLDDGGQTFTLYEASLDGEKISETNINQALNLSDGEWLQSMDINEQGDLFFMLSTGRGSSLIALNNDMSLKGRIDSNNYLYGILISGREAYVTTWGESGMVLKRADFSTGSLGNDISLGLGGFGNISFASGGRTGILLSDGSGIYEYDIEKSVSNKLLDFIDSDVNASNAQYFGYLDNGNFWLMNQLHTRRGAQSELIILNQTTYGELPKREYISFGTLMLNSDMRNNIIEFNKINPKYRIRVKEYMSDFNADYSEALSQFNIDLAGAGAPDMIDLSGVNFNRLAANGAFEDINPYFDKSQVLNRSDYFENILNAYSFNGKLYGIMSGFAINAMAGHASRLEGIDSWTLSEMMAWALNYPESSLMQSTASSIMYTMAYFSIDKFVNWDTGEINFLSDEFIGILEFASGFGEEWVNWDDPNYIGRYEGLRDGHYLLDEQYIYDLDSMQLNNSLFDGEAKYIGYPTDSGSGIAISPASSIAMSSRSKHKDGVFEFIEYLLSEDNQSDNSIYRFGIPIKISAFDKVNAEAMVPWHVDEDGNEIPSQWGYDSVVFEMYASKNADFLDTYIDLIKKADRLHSYDEQMIMIIQEETESFFAGQKSAADAAAIIQNRVQIYVNENR